MCAAPTDSLHQDGLEMLFEGVWFPETASTPRRRNWRALNQGSAAKAALILRWCGTAEAMP
jgi:hypothetical protein